MLGIPPEVLENILLRVLAYNTIHIKFVYGPYLVNSLARSLDLKFRHAICVDLGWEEDMERSSHSTIVPASPVELSDELSEYRTELSTRHYYCQCFGSFHDTKLAKEAGLSMHLGVLRACRQLYHPANYYLLTTNTFSFDDPMAFTRFMARQPLKNKHQLRTLYFTTHIGGRLTPNARDWAMSLSRQNINTLHNLTTIHLTLIQSFGDPEKLDEHPTPRKQSVEDQRRHLVPFMRLRALPLTHATVEIYHDGIDRNHPGAQDWVWSPEQQEAYADMIRAELLDKDGAEKVKAEDEANKEKGITVAKQIGFMRGDIERVPTGPVYKDDDALSFFFR